MTPEMVLEFWLDEVGPKGWYNGTPELDAKIRDKFLVAWEEAAEGAYGLWLTYPTGALAYIILTDQFPRNMFRGEGQSFATDFPARAAAKVAIDHGWDLRIHEPARQFFYLPLMHSESQCDQDRCVRLMHERLPESGAGNLLHAKVHREIIRKFGRFPYRNEALSRATTKAEADFLGNGGYGGLLREWQEKQHLEVVG
ncbi:DUF924 domain-containing protein [Donghicola sp. C2-DW-16]|uniref:DUF924 domain-containing protein n=1 Tax=Donghicola mangrovi TaxID=2729614 RepID=A0A850Q398_9RHOB|nr:DUF924 family protein [Donghicola mangrovi]NVO23576.1 DUF924 domain-containing protein [Donghicola mangrovi]NVO26966.1 DUF924 domain-containing protein [Donghicola mangrovi]